ncbi:MAG: monoheme cytochrome C [Crocinitomicaceae bacterium]|nr:monoheme cytochrome C [Crocinitomicaceae bacterium]
MENEARKYVNLFAFIVILALFWPYLSELRPGLFKKHVEITPYKVEEKPEVVDGIEIESGLIYAEGYLLVKQQCTSCHSLELVTQNRATRAGWKENIRWMQETQGLWDLGTLEGPILDYLSKNYGPKEASRRANLKNIEWYEL